MFQLSSIAFLSIPKYLDNNVFLLSLFFSLAVSETISWYCKWVGWANSSQRPCSLNDWGPFGTRGLSEGCLCWKWRTQGQDYCNNLFDYVPLLHTFSPIYCDPKYIENLKNLIGAYIKDFKNFWHISIMHSQKFSKRDFYPTWKVFVPKSRRKLLNVISSSRKEKFHSF